MTRLVSSLLAGVALAAQTLPASAQTPPTTAQSAPATAQSAPAAPAPDVAGEDVREEPARVQWQRALLVRGVGEEDFVYGARDADMSVIVWLDPECPYCKAFNGVAEAVVDQSKGRVNLAIRMLPLPMHGDIAVKASLAALCTGQIGGSKGYFGFLHEWLRRTATNGGGVTATAAEKKKGGALVAIAVESGARSPAALEACGRKVETVERLTLDTRLASAAGIDGTPSIAIRDNTDAATVMTAGAIGVEDLKAAINFLASRPGRKIDARVPVKPVQKETELPRNDQAAAARPVPAEG